MKNFVNLTNGIEFIPELNDYSFIRIQSTTLENNDWGKLFADLDHNLLMWLALGEECVIYDCGCNRPRSRVIYMGVPIIRYCLERYWLGKKIDTVIIGRNGHNAKDFVEYDVYQKIFMYHHGDGEININRKYRYYRKFIPDGMNSVKLVGKSMATNHDGDWEYYKDVINRKGQI